MLDRAFGTPSHQARPGESGCALCEAEPVPGDLFNGDPAAHSPACPWRQAKEALAQASQPTTGPGLSP